MGGGPIALQDMRIHRLQQFPETSESAGQGALGNVQPFQSQNFPDPIPRPLEQELLQKNLNPKPDRKQALGETVASLQRTCCLANVAPPRQDAAIEQEVTEETEVPINSLLSLFPPVQNPLVLGDWTSVSAVLTL